MSIKITDWDASEYLDNEESIQAYLNDAFDSGDPKLIASAIGDVARARGMTQIATDTGFAREALYRALSEKGNPGLATVIGVLKSLNMSVRVEAITPPSNSNAAPDPVWEVGGAQNYECGSLYAQIIATEFSPSVIILDNSTKEIYYHSGGTGVQNERPVIRSTGKIRGARIRSKIHPAGTASASPTFKSATSLT